MRISNEPRNHNRHINPARQRGGRLVGLFIFLLLILSGCDSPQVTQGEIAVSLSADGEIHQVQIAAGSTAEEAFEIAGVVVNDLDRSEPPLFTILTDGANVRLIRVREEFDVEQVVIPFLQQVLRNESLPEGEELLLQAGVNGLQEVTYRRVYEDGEMVSDGVVKVVIITEATPEIKMVGSQSAFSSVSIPGRLVYLAAGNAWLMEGSTNDRRPIVMTGDLDGHVFSLNPGGDWLLFSRSEADEEVINSLWVVKVDDPDLMIDLGVQNVIHFADWSPTTLLKIAYSTVEPRATAPGWQANNDLITITFSSTGAVNRGQIIVDTNSGGLYGWWGTTYAWAPDGQRLAYARPDEVGVVALREQVLQPVYAITPLQTRSDWAWTPDIAWGPDNNFLYIVDHAPPPALVSPEESPFFDISAIPFIGGPPVRLVSEVGMFAAPSPSPLQVTPTGEQGYQIAFLQALSPTQSETSRYRLMVVDRDGSNPGAIFPPDGAPGLSPQRVVWSPSPLLGREGHTLAVIYQGNLWLVDVLTGQAQQLTGDGLISLVDWVGR